MIKLFSLLSMIGALLSIIAAFSMLIIGNTNRALRELREASIIPIPFVIIFLIIAIILTLVDMSNSKKNQIKTN